MMENYILVGKVPVIETDLMKWAAWYQKADRIVKQTVLPDGTKVSTVFLGTDYSIGDSKPILFETMIFGGEYDEYQERYSTWEEAEEGHEKAITLIYS